VIPVFGPPQNSFVVSQNCWAPANKELNMPIINIRKYLVDVFSILKSKCDIIFEDYIFEKRLRKVFSRNINFSEIIDG
jgi:hypothetical protein